MQIRLMLVEDESPIRRGILRHVPFSKLGIDRVESAANAEEALAVLEEYAPDIILSDIRMPGMEGIDLCKICRESLPDCQIIFISGYSDKEYLTSAIALGAVSYIEKPIDIEELIGAVQKAVEAVERLYRQKRNLLHNILTLPSEMTRDLLVGIREEEGYFLPILLLGKEDLVSISGLSGRLEDKLTGLRMGVGEVLFDVLGGSLYCLLIRSRKAWEAGQDRWLGDLILSFRGEDELWFLAMGCPIAGSLFSCLSELKEELTRLKRQLTSLSYLGWNRLSFPEDVAVEGNYSQSAEDLEDFQRCLVLPETQGAKDYVRAFGRELTNRRAAMNLSVRNHFCSLIEMIERVLGGGAGDSVYEAGYSFVEDARSIEEACDYLCSYIEERKNLKKGGTGHYIIKEVCSYIEGNLQRADLSIRDLSAEVCLAPTYLSALFRKKMGKTISSYLQEERMKRACDLLKDPRLKQYEVAGLVGYDDAKYFARAFKKKIGISPSEYRERLM